MKKSPITTHVLDTALGLPAENIQLQLSRLEGDDFFILAEAATDADGRVSDLLPQQDLQAGVYRIRFELSAYFKRQQSPAFYPYAEVVFSIDELDRHYHIPLLLSPFGYSTYRGS